MISASELVQAIRFIQRDLFCEWKGCIIAISDECNRRAVEQDIDELLWKRTARIDVEKLLNHEHVRDMLSNFKRGDLDVAGLRTIGELWCGLIERSLLRSYPDNNFNTSIINEGGDVIVTFFQTE